MNNNAERHFMKDMNVKKHCFQLNSNPNFDIKIKKVLTKIALHKDS